MKCICGKELNNELDTFGDVNLPMCWNCYSSLLGEQGETCYGLGPHHHDLSLTGSYIGSTVMDDQNDPEFHPDPDVPGMGVWVRKLAPGWR